MHQHDIKLQPIEENLEGEIAERLYYECHFCQKTVGLLPEQRKICEKLSGKQFYCNFCLQNLLCTKNNRHILIMSFRGIIGFYHQILYFANKKLYHSQIQDFIQAHEEVGLLNPVFRYDPESYLWFVDFSRIGKGKKKLPLTEVLKTTVNILACFNLTECVDYLKPSKVYEKFETAITKFHTHRFRPENKKILVPTLVGSGGQCDNKNINHEELKNFTRADFFMR